MARSAKKLANELRSEGWRPGQDIRQTQTFEALSEACGCDTEGHAVEGAKSALHLGDDADGFTIRDLYENLVVTRSTGEPVGRNFINEYMDPQHPRMVSEAIDAVDSSAFLGVTGQLMVTHMLEPATREEFVARKMVPTLNSPLKHERWIGLATPADPGVDALLVPEGKDFGMFGFGEEYVETPDTRKWGGIIGLTKEAVFFNLTGTITKQAQEMGMLLALREEKEVLGVMIGGTKDPVYYKEKKQFDDALVTLDLFQRASGSGTYQLADTYSSRLHPFVNEIPDNPLTDYTNIRTCDQYFSNIVDPNTGEPIVVGKPFVFAPHTKRMDIMHMLEAEQIWKMSAGGLSSTGGVNTLGPNVLSRIGLTADQFATSRQLKAQLVAQFANLSAAEADDVWFYGDPSEAFKYVTNWPLTVVQAPTNSEAEFRSDIILRWKASKQGRMVISNPRAWLRNNFYRSGSAITAS